MDDDYILDKVFDKIKEIIGIKKFDDTKIICQIIQGFDLTFQKWFVSFSIKYNYKTDLKRHPQWLSNGEKFSI